MPEKTFGKQKQLLFETNEPSKAFFTDVQLLVEF